MSLKLWCPDCNTQTIVDMMSVYDGYEFACDDCKRVFYVRIERGLTPLAPDAWESAPFQAAANASADSKSQTLSTPTKRR